MLNVHLVCIDIQNDFISGSLPVPGALEDVGRTAAMIERLSNAGKLSDITVTLDSHTIVDISHPEAWVNEFGKHPDPFTIITVSDMDTGKWRARLIGLQNRFLSYLKQLEANKRYPHVIWPEHCLIGTAGHNLHPTLVGAINHWERKHFARPNFQTKGSHPWTEHFSAVRAEVPDPEDNSTQINHSFVESVENADITVWTGQALSHCLANTFRDTVDCFSDPRAISKMVLLTDATSNVGGFEKLGEDFIRDMTAKGMRLSTTVDFLA